MSSPSTSTPCPPAPLCELLLGPVFAECHGLIPPGPFFTACVSDSCWPGSHPGLPCQSLEAYAGLCRSRGVCSDWRNATGGLCDLPCRPPKVYQPCGPVQPMSCDSRSQSPVDAELTEGCFCPEDQILFNTHTDICVPQCPCVGPDGFPKFPGERWVSDCQICTCDPTTVSVQCRPVQCEPQDQALNCSGVGFVPGTRPSPDNPCCLERLCVCNTTTCPQSPPQCELGQELTSTQGDADCCPTFSCRPKLCTYNGTVYGVGATFSGVVPCHTCTCLLEGAQDPTVQCERDSCTTTCPQGFEHSWADGQCCGECVQTACLTPEGRLIQPNETWVNSRVDNCTRYRCEAEQGLPVLTPQPVSCPDVSSCQGTLRKTGCCYSCEEAGKLRCLCACSSSPQPTMGGPAPTPSPGKVLGWRAGLPPLCEGASGSAPASPLPRLVPRPCQHNCPAVPGLRGRGTGHRDLLRGLLPRSVQVSGPAVTTPAALPCASGDTYAPWCCPPCPRHLHAARPRGPGHMYHGAGSRALRGPGLQPAGVGMA
uniref:VWFC domain-containing protein n=1 Tax=Oryctolagus cuniculus TaxID=9986 RepID=A0A5F9CB56_RABIT